METILINTDLLDREDLDIYGKMCCVILARLAQEDSPSPLSLEELAKRMGCKVRAAGAALELLIDKGLLIEEPALELAELKTEAQRVRRKDRQSPAVTFQTFDTPKLSSKQQLEALREFIHEPATDATLRIILNMAGGDVERIRTAYQSAAAAQISDTLEYLMNILQQGERDPLPPVAAEPEILEPQALEPETRQVLTQINQKRIAELYSKNKQRR